LLAILTEDAGHPDLFTNDSFHRCSVCALVVKETFALMIVEQGVLTTLSRWDREGTTMSNFNLRLLLTFSVLIIPGSTRIIILEVPAVN
jgi:hypothetical protein